MKVVALVGFVYQGDRRVGERFEMPDREAEAYIATGMVKQAPKVGRPPKPKPAEVKEAT